MLSDWGNYYNRCSYCNKRYHASEGGCGCLDDHEKCYDCRTSRFFRGSGNQYAEEGWHHISALTEIGDKYFCEEHRVCGCCEAEKDDGDLTWDSGADMLLCAKCSDDDHYCEKDGPLLDYLAKKAQPADQ